MKKDMEETPTIQLPKWLDDLIFNELGAKYCRQNATMTNIDDDKEKALNYLGTYFPRSYAESYILFSALFEEERLAFIGKEQLSIFDFGCGTGGEIIGLLTAIEEKLPEVQSVEIVAFDGNNSALRLYEQVLKNLRKRSRLKVKSRIFPAKIVDFYDLSIVNEVINLKFDLIITFKAICEFVSKQQFEQQNPYEHIVKTLLPKLNKNGLMVLVDITVPIYNGISEEWLPKMMDKGLKATDCEVVFYNPGYNISIYITHSHKVNDVSKVAWRVIKNQ